MFYPIILLTLCIQKLSFRYKSSVDEKMKTYNAKPLYIRLNQKTGSTAYTDPEYQQLTTLFGSTNTAIMLTLKN